MQSQHSPVELGAGAEGQEREGLTPDLLLLTLRHSVVISAATQQPAEHMRMPTC